MPPNSVTSHCVFQFKDETEDVSSSSCESLKEAALGQTVAGLLAPPPYATFAIDGE